MAVRGLVHRDIKPSNVERDLKPDNVIVVRRERVDVGRHRRLVKLLADLLDSPEAPEEGGTDGRR